ncbi:MAG: DHH family phosphoesterase [Acidobacteria bacterium]|nr:MAG: DHH family phosphoesterase [Acidobacteriota bacterium]
MESQLVRAAEILESASSVALACHTSPDGDALGTMLGLHHILTSRGISAVSGFPSPLEVPPHYAFLPGAESLTAQPAYPAAPEVMVTVDCGSIDRLDDLRPSAEAARTLVVIDHHGSNTNYGHVNVIDPSAAASALIVFRMARERGWEINSDAAMCLYTGIATDTGRFQFDNTTPEVFRAVADLAEIGVPIAPVSRTLFEEHRLAFMKFLGRVLSRCELDAERQMVISWYDQADLEYFGVTMPETESVIDFIRQAKEAEVALLVKESAPGEIKVSLRSLGGIDVASICVERGGGGHRMAAGYTSRMGIHETIAELKMAVGAAMSERGPTA